MDLSPNNNVSVKRRAADIEELEKKFAQADSSITRSIERTEIGYLKSTHSQSKKLSMDLKKENISTDSRKPRPQSAENNKKRRLVESETEAIPILCLYSRYLQFHRLLFNIQSKFEIAETQAKKDLAIGYEAVKRKEEAVQKQTLEEEDKENSVKCYLSKLKGVLKQVNQRLENDQEIDYERGVLSDMLIELKDIKVRERSKYFYVKTQCD
ncbi:hypothetical protein BY458DRAFT_496390 [Sporodiniella umbellata]|nr:hypothetical protein BY458DRAFT_496390 [Sporodiniella umbellata]